MKILLIEPDKVLAENYLYVLKRAGHSVNWQRSAQSAINDADNETPDLVVVELQAPSHNGIEFLYEFRSYAEWQDIPAVVLSLVPEEKVVGPDNDLLERLGVKAYLYKPQTKLEQLVAAVNRVIEPAAA